MWLESFSRKEKRILAALACFSFLLRLPLTLRSVSALTGQPYGDDAFYLFSIAKHLAFGSGPTVDGTSLTNGFQPLIVLLYTPVFWLCSPNAWLAVRWTFLLNGVIAALTCYAVALFLRTIETRPNRGGMSAPVIGATLWTFTYSIFVQITNGLETGLASLLILAALTLYASNNSKTAPAKPSQWILLGLLLGFTILARIDAAILVAVIVLMLIARDRLNPAIMTGMGALVVSLPWWLFNWTYFGNFMPTSGQAENIWPLPAHENIHRATEAVTDILSLVFYLPGSVSFPLRVLWLIVLLAGIFIVTMRTGALRRIRSEIRMEALLPLLLFSVLLFFYYTFFFRAPHFLERYFQPARMLWLLIVATGVAGLLREKIARKVIIVAGLASLLFGIDRYMVNYYGSQTTDFYDMSSWANDHAGEKIGMLQSGIASFNAPNIINLDGKVNTAALRAHQQGRLAQYLRTAHFTYIADDKPFIEDVAAIARTDELFFDSVTMIDHIQLMKRRDSSLQH